jgi:hypothetical protein
VRACHDCGLMEDEVDDVPITRMSWDTMGVMRIVLILRVNQLAQGYKKSTFHRYVPLHPSI